MAKYRITIEVEVDTELTTAPITQLLNATKKVFGSLEDLDNEHRLEVTKGKWQKSHRAHGPMRYKCAKVRQPKPQALTVEDCQKIEHELHGLGSYELGIDTWHIKDSNKARAIGSRQVEKALSFFCNSRQKLMRFKQYYNLGGFNSRGLTDKELAMAMTVRWMDKHQFSWVHI